MTARRSIDRYALFGESPRPIAPEFLHIEPISVRSSLYEWQIAAHAHPGIFQLLLLEAGSGVLVSDGVEVTLVPVSLVALPSGCVHEFHFAPDAEGWVLSIAADLLNDARVGSLCDASRLAAGAMRSAMLEGSGALAGRLSWLLADLAAGLEQGRSGMLANALVAELGMVLALADEELGRAAKARAPSRRDDLAARFKAQVELHFCDGWSVSRYASALGTTGPTLTRCCREVLLRSPGEVVLDRILLQAMRGLTYSTASVAQIAASLGFADPAYFARFFKARTGMTAGVFRHQRAWFGDVTALPLSGDAA